MARDVTEDDARWAVGYARKVLGWRAAGDDEWQGVALLALAKAAARADDGPLRPLAAVVIKGDLRLHRRSWSRRRGLRGVPSRVWVGVVSLDRDAPAPARAPRALLADAVRDAFDSLPPGHRGALSRVHGIGGTRWEGWIHPRVREDADRALELLRRRLAPLMDDDAA